MISCNLKAKPTLGDQTVVHYYGLFLLFSNCLIKKKRILKGDLRQLQKLLSYTYHCLQEQFQD